MAKLNHTPRVYPFVITSYEVQTSVGRAVRGFDQALYDDGTAHRFLRTQPDTYRLVRVRIIQEDVTAVVRNANADLRIVA